MTKQQKFFIFLILTATCYLLIAIVRYWFADTLYSKAKNLNRGDDPRSAQPLIISALNISPNEPLYHLELSESYTKLGLPEKAMAESQKAIELSPNNVNLKRAQFSMYIRLSLINPEYLTPAVEVLERAIQRAPTDAKLFYNLGLTYARLGQIDKAINIMQKTIELKPNYNEAKQALKILQNDIIGP